MSFFNLSNNQASLDEINNRIKSGSELDGTNLLVLLFAILIASIGLNINSIPVIIGAMLISPLMGPIIGMAFFISRNDILNFKLALINLIKFWFLSIFLSSIYFTLSPINVATVEILNRINPTIWDALVAILGGLAGFVAITRKDFNNILPGVAIATSLMPPLCTMGYGISHLDYNIIINAFYLFFLNTFFMILSTMFMMHVIHIPEIKLEKKTKIKHYFTIACITLLILIPSIIKGKEIIEIEIFDVNVHNLISDIKKNNLILLSNDIDKDERKLVLTIVEDENIEKVNFEPFSNKYNLKIHIIKKQQNINIEQIKTQIKNEFNKKEEEYKNELTLRQKQELLINLKKDLIILNKNIKNVMLDKESNTLYLFLIKTSKKDIINVEEVYPYIKEKLNNKNLNIEVVSIVK